MYVRKEAFQTYEILKKRRAAKKAKETELDAVKFSGIAKANKSRFKDYHSRRVIY